MELWVATFASHLPGIQPINTDVITSAVAHLIRAVPVY